MRLPLKRPSLSRSGGDWSGDDYDVLCDGKAVGPIFFVNPASCYRLRHIRVHLGMSINRRVR